MRAPMRFTVGILVAALGLPTATPALAQDPRHVMEGALSLTGKDAINQTGFVSIGGIKQWVSVRGRHRSNPILLVLHGGPAFTLSPVSYWYMRDWEEYFTVVQWDQRGAGKTYAANDPAAARPTMSVDRLVEDGADLIRYLERTYGQKRVVLFGHSFGTLLGTELAQRHPELLYAYVGTGQFTDFQRSEALGYRETLADAQAAHNDQAVSELRAIAPFPDPARPERNLKNLGTERRWLAEYGGYYKAGGVGHNGEIASLSPDYSAEELKMRDVAQGYSDGALWGELGKINLMNRTRFRVPVVILQGRHDRGTSASLAAEWFARIKAPAKRFIWFEDSAHMTYEEEPGKMLVTLVDIALPLTRPK